MFIVHAYLLHNILSNISPYYYMTILKRRKLQSLNWQRERDYYSTNLLILNILSYSRDAKILRTQGI